MISISLYVEKEQKDFFYKRRIKTGIPAAVQMREAFNDYINKHQEE